MGDVFAVWLILGIFWLVSGLLEWIPNLKQRLKSWRVRHKKIVPVRFDFELGCDDEWPQMR